MHQDLNTFYLRSESGKRLRVKSQFVMGSQLADYVESDEGQRLYCESEDPLVFVDEIRMERYTLDSSQTPEQ